ncbi:MAG: DUF262 domain-containing protein [Bacteroidales bacterium]|nr:DUF262 domain-containing protein [Bacteroidales bacterium]
MANIGFITNFANFINKYSVEIPRIQRDYTYGSGTEKTEKVLTKLLKDIHESLKGNKELILDFVYGCNDNSALSTFQPLDGQQRLTSLYLIYFFAACRAGEKIDKSFKYATRDDSTIFCEELLQLVYNKKAGLLVDQIKDSAFFRPSFNDDPSIRSMLVVLKKIEEVFSDMVEDTNPSELWDAINNQTCPVKFYCLDFGVFTLSDDLYIKMNSRGKQLTEYEIFKSQFEKYIEISFGKDLKYDIAKLFDNDYIDLVWEKQGRDKSKIDGAFVFLFKNIFNILNHKFSKGVQFDWKKPLYENMLLLNIDKSDIDFIKDFFTYFIYIESNPAFLNNFYFDDMNVLDDGSGRIRFFKSNVDVFEDACSSVLNNPKLVSLYAVYTAIKAEKNGVTNWQLNLRHIRNLIEFSDDELGHTERIPDMLSEIDDIIRGNITSISSSKFNTTQFEEEVEKDKNVSEWQQLFAYENHDVLRGSLSLFSHPNKFVLSNPSEFKRILDRLQKFTVVFDNISKKNDHMIRASLLSIGDFGQKHLSSDQKKMFGCQYSSWRLMFTKSAYFGDVKIMDVLDKITPSSFGISTLSTEDWRYYATSHKYYEHTYVSYGAPKYGYCYFEDESRKPLEVWLLQSTSCSSDNVMWKLLNNLLFFNLPSGLDVHFYKYQEDHTVRINNKVSFDALQDGWIVEDLTDDKHIINWLVASTSVQGSYNGITGQGFLNHVKGNDYIDEILGIINELLRNSLL